MTSEDPRLADGSERAAGSSQAARFSDRLALALSLLPGTTFMLFFIWRSGANPSGSRRFTLFDDAMISLTYGRTLATSGEFVWFPGAPRTQGFTNPLWTLYMAFLQMVGLRGSGAALAVSLTGVMLILAAAVLVFLLLRRALGRAPTTRPFWLFGAASIPFLYPLTYWTLRGMEVGLLAALLLAMIWAAPLETDGDSATRRLVIAGVAGVLGVMTRLDFAIIVVVLLAWCWKWAENRRERSRLLLFIGVPVGVALGSVLLFQRHYWGDWLPNTYRLKIEGFSIQERFARGVVTYGKVLPVLALVLLGLVVVLRLDRGIARRLALLLTSVFAVTSAYSVWVGGDAWEWSKYANRYISVVLPAAVVVVLLAVGLLLRNDARPTLRWSLAALCLAPAAAIGAGLSSNPFRFETKLALAMVAIALLAVGGLVFALNRQHAGSGSVRGVILIAGFAVMTVLGVTSIRPMYKWARDGGVHVTDDQMMTERALALQAATQNGAVVATVWAGAPAYYSGRTMIDLLGKSDAVISRTPPHGNLYPGHNKWDYDYSIGALRPDVVFQLGSLAPSPERFSEWGYVHRCLEVHSDGVAPVYVLASSTYVNWSHFRDCPTATE